jgi:hypothetical protein
VPLSVTPRIQEVHTVTYHIVCEAVESALCKPLAHVRSYRAATVRESVPDSD